MLVFVNHVNLLTPLISRFWWVWLALGTLGALRWMLRGWIYDILVVDATRQWYADVLRRFKTGERVLDVGIGTAAALVRNGAAIKQKRLNIVGIDYDKAYIDRAKDIIRSSKLSKHVQVHHASVYDYRDGQLFDSVYFSGSLMIMPDPVAALKHCASLVKPGHYIYSTQTLETKRSFLAELTKPLLSWVTGIEFGSVTYLDQVPKTWAAAGLKVEILPVPLDYNPLKRNICLIVAQVPL